MVNGYGCFTSTTGSHYTGFWKDNRHHGDGSLRKATGELYCGQYKDGKRHGFGTLTWRDGSKYRGHFHQGAMQGCGEFTWVDGRHYIGEWFQNSMDGRGVCHWKNSGRQYDGQYKGDMKHGIGVFSWEDGRLFVGEWKEGKSHGLGVLKSGEKFLVGEWQNGQRVGNWLNDMDAQQLLTHYLETLGSVPIVEARLIDVDSSDDRYLHFETLEEILAKKSSEDVTCSTSPGVISQHNKNNSISFNSSVQFGAPHHPLEKHIDNIHTNYFNNNISPGQNHNNNNNMVDTGGLKSLNTTTHNNFAETPNNKKTNTSMMIHQIDQTSPSKRFVLNGNQKMQETDSNLQQQQQQQYSRNVSPRQPQQFMTENYSNIISPRAAGASQHLPMNVPDYPSSYPMNALEQLHQQRQTPIPSDVLL